ncbi:dTMP kinase [Allokutzneria oryzae]|uniref:Thymidylate kinase n=1 Tax=Allokutzneria oryzae TaxID=1378989 RepID=A0ABV5ZX57_9PSEU
MGRLIVIEGLDGSGKRTLTDALTKELTDRGLSSTRWAFPRYGESVHADLIHDAMHNRLGPLVDTVYGMAVLYALDRQAAAAGIRADLEKFDVVLIDRYLASNAAYCAARLHEDAHGDMVRWVRDVELGRFELPVPDAHLLLRVPVEVAAARTAHREGSEVGRERDSYETDGGLQARCSKVYEQLAELNWVSPWHVVDGSTAVDAAALADRILG